MVKRLAVLLCLALTGLSLAGCSKCGWVWDNMHACHGAAPRN
jgi:hypothetical protein